MRDWYQRNRERVLERQRDWNASNRERRVLRQREFRKTHRDTRKREGRSGYMRQWWAELRTDDPVRHAKHVKRSNSARAVKGLPAQLHEMRLVLMEFRSRERSR